MPRRAAALLAALCLLCALAAPALAAGKASASRPVPGKQASGKQGPSPQALALREQGDLVPFVPPPEVLAAYFTADENAPHFVYGPVSAYAKARTCPTAWLMEKGEVARVARLKAKADAPSFEFSLTLEEDCEGGKVTHAVFVIAPGSSAEAWFAWRRQFHGGKAVGYYGGAQEGLKRAEAAGLAPTAELRFLSVNGELDIGNLEDSLRAEGRLVPVFDLQQAKAR